MKRFSLTIQTVTSSYFAGHSARPSTSSERYQSRVVTRSRCILPDKISPVLNSTVSYNSPLLHEHAHLRRKAGDESRNSLTRLSVTRDGFAAGLLAMIHCKRVRIDSLLELAATHHTVNAIAHSSLGEQGNVPGTPGSTILPSSSKHIWIAANAIPTLASLPESQHTQIASPAVRRALM